MRHLHILSSRLRFRPPRASGRAIVAASAARRAFFATKGGASPCPGLEPGWILQGPKLRSAPALRGGREVRWRFARCQRQSPVNGYGCRMASSSACSRVRLVMVFPRAGVISARRLLESTRKEQGGAEADEPEYDQRGHRPRVGSVSCGDDGDEDRARDCGAERRAQVGDTPREP